MELMLLREKLEQIEKSNSARDWFTGLNQRKKAELEFHNRDRDKQLTQSLPQDTYELLHGNKKYYSTVELSQTYIENWFQKHVPGKVFLDYACGNGLQAIKAAKLGANLAIGLDISDVSVRNAREMAEGLGLGERCKFIQGDCENTGLPDNSVDVILCSGMLHHLDLSYAFPELRRILKPGGVILAVEALDYNPFIKAYRMLTPSMRTEWEKNHILSLRDVNFGERFFEIGEIRYWHMFSIFAAYLHRHEKLMKPLLKVFNLMDAVLTRIPFVQLMAWQFTFELIKRPE
jgi:SAM-dependent methyltransferase